MVCRCQPLPWRLGLRRRRLLKFAAQRRRLSGCSAACCRLKLSRLHDLQSNPKCIYLMNHGAKSAVCWRPSLDAKSGFCDRGVSRLRQRCASCRVVALDSEWTWHRTANNGVALLQLGFWPGGDVFCIRLTRPDAKGGKLPQRLPKSIRFLFERAARGEVAVVGFALHQDRLRLAEHGLQLQRSGAMDLQPWCSSRAHRALGMQISLKDAAFKFLGEDLDKGPRMSDWEGPLTHAQLKYAALDAWTTLRLFGRQKSQFKNVNT